MSMVENINGQHIDFDAAVVLMDDDLREKVHVELAPCTEQEFIDRYAQLHQERFGTGFAPYTGDDW